MTDRETVAEGLKCRAENRLTKDCEHCHYGWAMARRWGCNFVKLSGDALKLLEADAPRVLTLEELKALPDGSVVWEEFFNGEEGVATHLGPGMVCAGQIITPDSQGDLAECLRGWTDAIEQAIALLKAQEPKPVHVTAEINHRKIGECPNCGKPINSGDYSNYCGACGQAVKWDG